MGNCTKSLGWFHGLDITSWTEDDPSTSVPTAYADWDQRQPQCTEFWHSLDFCLYPLQCRGHRMFDLNLIHKFWEGKKTYRHTRSQCKAVFKPQTWDWENMVRVLDLVLNSSKLVSNAVVWFFVCHWSFTLGMINLKTPWLKNLLTFT